jgi:acyl-CoA dehydrogenase
MADAATEVHCAHLLALHTAALLDEGHDATKEAAMAKAFATEAGFRAVDRAIQVHGGMGITAELGLVEAWHQLRGVHIADGSAEMMRRLIARRLSMGDLEL